MVGAPHRRLATRALFGSVALGTTCYVCSITVVPLVGEDLTGSKTLSGFPWAAGVFGTGFGSYLWSQVMARKGRGPGLIGALVVGIIGAILAVVAIVHGSFWLFVFAILVMGQGNAANHLARYAAADLYPPNQRASGLGMVVWAGTIGGVAGPALLDPTSNAAANADLPKLTGPFLLAIGGLVIAALALFTLMRVVRGAFTPHDDGELLPSGATFSEMLRVPRAQAALISLAVTQTVMVLIMAMTPLHMRDHGHGLGQVGFVISVHVFGMYGMSPVSGRLSDRFGRVPMILVGFAVLGAAAVGAATFPADSGRLLAIPLFLLGFGWSLAFVSGSALLTEGLSYADRARLQGSTDAVVWTAAGIAGLSSGVLVGAFSYGLLCIVGGLLLVAPTLVLGARRNALAVAASS